MDSESTRQLRIVSRARICTYKVDLSKAMANCTRTKLAVGVLIVKLISITLTRVGFNFVSSG